jgi:hypothetical protein
VSPGYTAIFGPVPGKGAAFRLFDVQGEQTTWVNPVLVERLLHEVLAESE